MGKITGELVNIMHNLCWAVLLKRKRKHFIICQTIEGTLVSERNQNIFFSVQSTDYLPCVAHVFSFKSLCFENPCFLLLANRTDFILPSYFILL